jgi:hypothetical protein
MSKAEMEKAAGWLEKQAELKNDLLGAALRAAAYEFRSYVASTLWIDPLGPMDSEVEELFEYLSRKVGAM